MRQVIEALSLGDGSLEELFVRARAFWAGKLPDLQSRTVDEIASEAHLWVADYRFAIDPDRYALAKETMAATAVAALFADGSDFADGHDFAARLLAGLIRSSAPLEVRSGARMAATLYNLSDHPDVQATSRVRW